MLISVNGEKLEVSPDSTIEDILDLLEISKERLAVEKNGEVLARKEVFSTVLLEGDKLEIVKAIGGG